MTIGNAGSFALIVLAGCAPPETIWIDLPPLDPEAKSVLFAVHGDALRMFASAIDPAPVIEVPGLVADDAEVEALTFRRSLADLGLEAGELPLDPSGSPIDRPLHTFRATLVDRAFSAWIEQQAPSAEVLEYPIQRMSKECDRLVSSRLYLPTASRALFALPVEVDAALLGTEDGRLFRVDADSAIEVASTATLAAGFAAADGTLWFIEGSLGHVLRGRWDGELSLELVVTSTASRQIEWLLVSDLLGFYGVSRRSVFYRIDSTRGNWLPIAQYRENTDYGSLVTDATAVFAAVDAGFDVLRYDGSDLRAEPVGAAEGRVSALAYSAPFGVLAGTRTGQIMQRDEGWSELARFAVPFRVLSFAPYGDGGFLIGTDAEFVAELVPGRGLCPPLEAAPPGEGLGLSVALGDRTLFAPNQNRKPADGPTPITFIQRVP